LPTTILALLAQSDAIPRLLAEGRFLDAWRDADQIPAEDERSSARARVLLEAGDPGGALIEARKGLEYRPQNLELLFHETTATLWLGNGSEAAEAAARLAAAVGTAGLDELEREQWRTAAKGRQEQAARQVEREACIKRAVTRSKWITISILGGALVVLALSPVLGRQGRSRRPVS
jgi:hypothetical protein